MNSLWATGTGFDVINRSIAEWRDAMFDAKAFHGIAGNGTYPPYNVKRLSPESVVMEMAVAGFTRDDLTVRHKGRSLEISGEITNKVDSGEEVTYIHKGISSKKFKQTFTLAENTEIGDVSLKEGMLTIHFYYKEPEAPESDILEIK